MRLLETIKMILDIPGINLTEKYDDRNTVLLIAVELSHGEEMISLLVNAGADINAVNIYEQNALHLAAKANNVGLIPFLIRLGVDLKHLDVVQNSFLHCFGTEVSRAEEFHEIINLLFSTERTDIFHVKNKKKQLPIHTAVLRIELNMETLKIFKAANVDFNCVDDDNSSLLMYAISGSRSIQFFTALIKIGVDVITKDVLGLTFTHVISKYYSAEQYHELATAIISTGNKEAFMIADNLGQTPLHFAVRYLEILPETIKHLHEHGVNFHIVDMHNQSLLFLVAYGKRSIAFLKTLLDVGIDVTIQRTDGNTFVHTIAETYSSREFHEIMELLIDRGYGHVYQGTNMSGHTPLHLAAVHITLHEDTLHLIREKLVKPGIVDINSREEYGSTILHTAIVGNSRILTNLGKTPLPLVKWDEQEENFLLYQSIEGGSKQNERHGKWNAHHLKILIDMGVDVSIQDTEGNTFLHHLPQYYSAEQYHDILELLLREGHGRVFQLENLHGNPPLHLAVNELELLDETMNLANRTLVETGVISINHKNKSGHSILFSAVKGARSVRFLETVLKMGANPLIQSNSGNTFAHLCTLFYSPKDYHSIVELIIKTGHERVFQVVNDSGQTPGGIAILQLELLHSTLLLISSSVFQTKIVDIDSKDADGNSFLMNAAIGKRSIPFLENFMKMGIDVTMQNNMGNTFLHEAAINYSPEEFNTLAKILVDAGEERVFQVINEKGQSPLHFAAYELELLEVTLDLVNDALFHTNVVDVNLSDQNGISLIVFGAMGQRSLNFMKKLLEMGANPAIADVHGNNLAHILPLHYSPQEYHSMVELLLQKGYWSIFHVVNDDDETALHVAVATLDLLEKTLDLFNAAPSNGNSADVDTREISLLRHVFAQGESLLHCALNGKRSVQFVKHLVSLGANVFVKTYHGSTLVHTCASYGLIDHLKYFFGLGCDVNTLDNDGDNVLHCAVYDATENVYELVTFLVASGADIRHKNNRKQTPYDYAVEKGIIDGSILNVLR